MMAAVLSVAVVNYETPELTARCVGSVHASPPSEPFEVIVVDNGSSASTVALLREVQGGRLVETGRNGGFAYAVNRCVAAADRAADVIVVLNSDTEVTPGALDALAAAARRDEVGLAAPVLLERDGAIQRSAHRRFPTLWTTWVALCVPASLLQALLDRFVAHPSTLSPAEHEAGVQPSHVMGAVMAISRPAWERVGPFDERFFMYLEETDWQQRLAEAGGHVTLVPRARVRHLHRGGERVLGVPLAYLDSAAVYFGARGRRALAVRAVLASALFVSWAALALYAPITRSIESHREPALASRRLARAGLVHVLRARRSPRPSAR
jgi:GT2 family glycosyltransferase